MSNGGFARLKVTADAEGGYEGLSGFSPVGSSSECSLLCPAPADHMLTCHNRILPTAFGGEDPPHLRSQHMAPEACLSLEEMFSVFLTLTFGRGYCPCILLGCFSNEGLLSKSLFCHALLYAESSWQFLQLTSPFHSIWDILVKK